MSVAQIRVEIRNLPSNSSFDQKDRAFRGMFSVFKRAVNEAGVLSEYNLKSRHESKSEKGRRKRKEAELRRNREGSLRTRLRDHFGQAKGE